MLQVVARLQDRRLRRAGVLGQRCLTSTSSFMSTLMIDADLRGCPHRRRQTRVYDVVEVRSQVVVFSGDEFLPHDPL